MGIINWFKDRRYDEVISNIKQLQADIQFLDAKVEAMKTNVNSLRGLWNKKVSKSSEPEEQEDDVEYIRRIFNGQLPIELAHIDKNKYTQETLKRDG